MNYLLDTSTLLWAARDPDRLSPRARRICVARKDSLVVSVISMWEIVIKSRTPGFDVSDPVERLAVWVEGLGARVLPVEAAHAYAVDRLPGIHRDPFDRMLVAQAVVEEMPILTKDEIIHRYPARCIW
ncbi:MAG TPA: type II toxin-antitoxin system VapC family toxin [Candidatus Acidoferrales bacterium]|nr:type II toxin-antitoxin system VapC family toxin [Candidatus Acidoferrales bacterium]